MEKNSRSTATSSLPISSTELESSIDTDAINQVSFEDHHVEKSERHSTSAQQSFVLFRPVSQFYSKMNVYTCFI